MRGAFRSFRPVSKTPRLALEPLESRDVPATITVTNALDDTNTGNGVSLREALLSINAGANTNADVVASGTYGSADTVQFSIAATSVINLGSELPISKAVVVSGPSTTTLLTVRSNAAGSRVLNVNLATAGAVALNNLLITNGTATATGGGILSANAALQLTNTTVSGNTTSSTTGGGGIYLTSAAGSSLTMTNSTVRNNTAPSATSGGGGIYVRGSSAVTMTNSTLANNSSNFFGGGILFWLGGSFTVDNSTISGNTAVNDGGGIYLWSPTTLIRNSTISGNTAARGGAIVQLSSSAVTIRNSTIANNTATSTAAGSSGGIARTTTAGSLTLASTIFARNTGGATTDTVDLNLSGTSFASTNSLIGVLPATPALTGTGNLTGTAAAPLNPLLGTLASNGGPTQTMSIGPTSPAVDAGLAPLSPLPNVDQRGNAAFSQRDIGAFEYAPPPSPPSFTTANTITFTVGTAGTFTVNTLGNEIPALSLFSGTLPGGVTFTPNGNRGTLAGTPALGTGGVYNLVFRATNNLGAANQNFTLIVNERPRFTSPVSTQFVAGTPGNFTVTTAGYPFATLSVSGALPPGITFTNNGNGTGTLSGSALVVGPYPIMLRAGNGVGADATQSFTLNVVLKPLVVSAPTTTFVRGVAGSYTITAVGAPLPNVSISGALPPGVTYTFNGNGLGTLAGTPTQSGSYAFDVLADNGVNPPDVQAFVFNVADPASPPPPVSPPPPPPGGGGPIGPLLPPVPPSTPLPGTPFNPVVLLTTPGSGADGTQVRVVNPLTQQLVRAFTPFPGFGGAVATAVSDLNADGVADYLVGAGRGGGPHVKVFDGKTGLEAQSFFAYAPTFTGGVSLALGDVTGDGKDDLIVGAGAGGGPHVRAFDGATGQEVLSFFAFDPAFTGGVNVAAGDVNGDGRDDVVVGVQAGGAPHVRAFDGRTAAELLSFFAYGRSFLGGVNVAVGDLNGDKREEILTAAAGAGGPHVKVFDGVTGREQNGFMAYDPSFTGGVSVAAMDVNGDGLDEILTGAGPGGGPHVKVFDGITLLSTSGFYAVEDAFRGGVLVG